MDIREANEAVASHPLFQRCHENPLFRVSHLLLHCFFEKPINHSRVTFKQALKQVIYLHRSRSRKILGGAMDLRPKK